jgi:hypothetical protein
MNLSYSITELPDTSTLKQTMIHTYVLNRGGKVSEVRQMRLSLLARPILSGSKTDWRNRATHFMRKENEG